VTTEIGLCDPQSAHRLPPDWFFASPGTPEAQAARMLCMECPLYNPCSEYALTQGVEYGIWGGVTREERVRTWKANGVRPEHFIDNYQSQIRPLLQERRDHEAASLETYDGAA
jgi:hypothetical protein